MIKKLLKMLLHYILVSAVMAERLLRRQKIKVVNKEQINIVKGIQGPIIFAPTHCGKFDIQILTEVLWQYRWSLLSGDPMWLPGTIEGYWLKLHGVIYVDRDDKGWRKRSKQEMIDHLNSGGNIMMYPEGTWNLSPNLPVLPLFRGIADVAIETNATIIPFAQEIDDSTKTYYVKIGTPLYPNTDPMKLLDELRNQMAELKWILAEELPFCKVSYDKEKLYTDWEQYVQNRLLECSYYSFELNWKYARREKWQIEQKQIITELSIVKPTTQTAFLFNKRWKS